MCTLHLAVFGFSNTSYTIVASQPEQELALRLASGVPQRSELQGNEWRFFSFSLANTSTLGFVVSVTAEYGDARYGSLNAPFNERGYVAIPPCLFGHQPGLPKPRTLKPDANLTAVKYFNNTWRHLGQMAQWTGLMVYDTDPW